MRLSKRLAQAGVASRRHSEELIFDGRIKVNGEVVLLPQTQVEETDEIRLDNEVVAEIEKKVYYLLNKPAGYLCSNKRLSKRQKLVIDLFEQGGERLFTVGRLDKETTGLLIVTNDGDLGQRIIHPSKSISKEYLVKADREITPEHLVAISNGARVEGVHVRPAGVKKVRRGTVKVTVFEGKKREVRLLIENAGLQVLELTRIRIGGLLLGKLPIGGIKKLTLKQIERVFE